MTKLQAIGRNVHELCDFLGHGLLKGFLRELEFLSVVAVAIVALSMNSVAREANACPAADGQVVDDPQPACANPEEPSQRHGDRARRFAAGQRDPDQAFDDTQRPWEDRAEGVVRIASFNLALERREANGLQTELRTGESIQARKLAEIIQRVRPDVLLLNEIDRDAIGENLDLFHKLYLQVSQNGQPGINFEHRFFPESNTGVDSGLDLNRNGVSGEPDDAYGFGRFEGQYGMAVLSRFPIKTENARTFQKFLWRDMPGARWPKTPVGDDFYSAEIRAVFRLSSKNHVVVPIEVPSGILHLVAAHPTPPVFDGPEDRNGLRNHDEIRLLADLLDPSAGAYLVDDQGRRGGLADDARFVVAGDMNADPKDGDSTNQSIQQLLGHPKINGDIGPRSNGAAQAAIAQGGINLQQTGDPAQDTADFNDDTTGNLRVDYVLPSANLQCVGSGVFWPNPTLPESELISASDHRLVWIDIR
ncbi:MAG: endonuclease/exonuclease/phosphatase family protein [Planctomycetaceae bacterium]|nr:endonuclease/exonuclease/phosphatase family protein [Planctomycetaceae bacterium]